MHNPPIRKSFWELKVSVLSLAWHVQQSTVSSKRSKASTECSTAPSLQCAEQYLAEVLDTSEKLSDAADASQTAGCCNGHTAMPKENRSPNLNFLDCFEAELDNYNDLNQVLKQITEGPQAQQAIWLFMQAVPQAISVC